MTSSMRDIEAPADIERLLRDFYGQCFTDDLLGPIFVDVARLDLEAHLPVMVDFWMTVLFRTGAYKRNLLQVHVDLHGRAPLTPAHLDRWLDLWVRTVEKDFSGEVADLAVTQAQRITWSMSRRLNGESGSELRTIQRRDLAKALPTV